MSLNQKHLPFFSAILLAVGIFVGTKLNSNSIPSYTSSKNISKQKLNRLIDYLEYEYVDPVGKPVEDSKIMYHYPVG